VPGAGWITFDPTNRSVGGFNLIPVAVVRDMPSDGLDQQLRDAIDYDLSGHGLKRGCRDRIAENVIRPCDISYPFRYSDGEWTDLGAMALPQYPDGAGRLRTWARHFVRSNPTDTLALLKDLNSGIAGTILYQRQRRINGLLVIDRCPSQP
jgi:hypothetical protein